MLISWIAAALFFALVVAGSENGTRAAEAADTAPAEKPVAAAPGADAATPSEAVVKIGDWEVTAAELTAEAGLLPPVAIERLHADANAARTFAFDWYADALFARAAEKERLLEREPGVRRASEAAARDVIARAYVRDLIERKFDPTEQELAQFYALHKEKLCAVPARYRVARAGVLLGRKATPAEIESATERMGEIEKRLAAGEDFAAVAAELSDYDVKAAEGEWVSGDDVAETGDPDGITSLGVGERSKAIESRTGRTIYAMLEREDARTLSVAECRATLERALTGQFQREIAVERVDQLGKEYGGSMNIDAFVAALRAVPRPPPQPPQQPPQMGARAAPR